MADSTYYAQCPKCDAEFECEEPEFPGESFLCPECPGEFKGVLFMKKVAYHRTLGRRLMQKKAAYKVALSQQTKNSKTYQLLCNCGDPEHNWVVDIELDKEWGPQVTIYGDMYYYEHYSYGGFFCEVRERITNYWERLKVVIRLLFTGYLKMNTDLLIMDEKHLDSFIGILEEGRDYCHQKKVGKKKE